MLRRSIVCGNLAAMLIVGLAMGADWPQFRGPTGTGAAEDKGLPTKWSEAENIVWKTELPGMGSSSPIVVKDKIYLSTYSGYGLDARTPGEPAALKRQVLCLGRGDGKIVWQEEVEQQLPDQPYDGNFLPLHGYASSTPASNGTAVYFFFGKSGVVCYSLDGKLRWKASVGSGIHNWGSGTSPVLTADLVIVNASVESDALVALKKSDGTPAWTAKGMKSSWNTPALVTVDGKQEVVVSVRGQLRGFDPANGTELWHCDGIQDYVCPSVIAHAGIVYAIGARKNTAIAVRAGGRGDVTKTHHLWTADKGSNVSSPVYHDGHLYWANESRGTVYCLKADDGAVVYEERLDPNPRRIYASPIVADGKLYYVSRNNGAYVLSASPKFALLSHNTLPDPTVFNASPAVSNGQLLLRSDRYLYCIGVKK